MRRAKWNYRHFWCTFAVQLSGIHEPEWLNNVGLSTITCTLKNAFTWKTHLHEKQNDREILQLKLLFTKQKKSLMMSKSVKCKMITLLRLHNSFRFHMTCFTFLFSIFKSWNLSFINFSHHSHRTRYTYSFSASKHIELNDKPMLRFI